MDNRPIGVLDSGVGGLTAVRELRKILPNEEIVYFGDTGRVPYGGKSRETVVRYARQDIRFLLSHHVKLVLAACGTVSAAFPEEEAEQLPVPYIGVVEPAVREACSRSKGKIGVIATPQAIRSEKYQQAIRDRFPDAELFSAACPLFVPLAENGHLSETDPIALAAAEFYLSPLRSQGIDTLILGCTHYPLLRTVIDRVLQRRVTLVDSGREAAREAFRILEVRGLLSGGQEDGRCRYYVSDSPEEFEKVAEVFLPDGLGGNVQMTDISHY